MTRILSVSACAFLITLALAFLAGPAGAGGLPGTAGELWFDIGLAAFAAFSAGIAAALIGSSLLFTALISLLMMAFLGTVTTAVLWLGDMAGSGALPA